MKNTYKTGRIGEDIILNLLPKATRSETYDHHDVDWEGITIEVKTSNYYITDKFNKTWFSFSGLYNSNAKVCVFLGLMDEKRYFWVYPGNKYKSTARVSLEEAFMNTKELSTRVKNLIQKGGVK